MENRLPERQHNILMTLIREFIETAEPVGSGTLTRKYNIPCSPATIRNEMARLEEEGLLYQPHTSAGRVPTDRAYRYYVNHLLQKKTTPSIDMTEILKEYERYQDHIERALEYTSRKLAGVTRLTSLILAPRLRKTTFKYLRLSPLEDNKILIILMTNTGAIINKVITLEDSMSEDELEKMTRILNDRLAGMFLNDIKMDFFEKLPEHLQKDILEQISLMTAQTLDEGDDQVIQDGTVNLLKEPEFQDLERLKMVMELLDEEKVVAEILKKTLTNEDVRIYIGREHKQAPLQECSLITATYGIGGESMGVIGIIGPMRMPYQRVIPVVNDVARVISRKLTDLAEG